MASEHYLPVFSEPALCTNYQPDWWFPEYDGTDSDKEQKLQERVARNICTECPAFKECYDYSMQFYGLYGIWAGRNRRERHREQRRLGIVTIKLIDTLPNLLYNIKQEEFNEEE
jgi:hypothetical protein